MPHIRPSEKRSRQLRLNSTIYVSVSRGLGRDGSGARASLLCCVSICLSSCESGAPPGAHEQGHSSLVPHLELSVGPSQGADRLTDSLAKAHDAAIASLGTVDDNLPFEPTAQQLASISWRTWVYTDVGSKRTRLGYLRAGQVVDIRGPEIRNDGCAGGWWRINPRGFVCVGKGASLDLSHPVARAASVRPIRGQGFPYYYAQSQERSPDRYFRLPTRAQMVEVEGSRVLDRGPAFRMRAKDNGWFELFDIATEPPAFLSESALPKPYGVRTHLRRQVHSGRTSSDSGFALLRNFFHEDRAFGLSSELDLLPLDRLELVREVPDFSVRLEGDLNLPVAFHVKGANTLWRKTESGHFVPEREIRERQGFALTGQRGRGGMIETTEGLWLAESTVRVIAPRDGFPSVATGRRKWIDISIRDQSLVAYEGQRPVYVTLISAGRGGLGERDDSNPEGEKTVRGTFMIHEKSLSSTMDGDEDRADSYELQDVPHVQYFHRGFALHGAYWHDEFGAKRSHGCVNLAPFDASWLFEWTDPQVPAGWHAALNKQRGTVVHVRY